LSLATDRSSLIRLQKDIGDLRTKEAAEVKKAANAQKKMAAAQSSAAKASSSGMRSSYLSTADREGRALQSALDSQRRYANQVASKTKDAARLQEKIMKEEERERKAALTADEKRRRDDDARRRSDDANQKRMADTSAAANRLLQTRVDELEAQVLAQLEATAEASPAFSPKPPQGEKEVYDVFISHASEDKAEFADEFAAKARDVGLRVWYDRFTLGWGDSLRQKIDAGLVSSYFGVVILSPSFFAKQWTNYELDGLLERSLDDSGRLLPIWHRLTKDDVKKYAPSLAGRLALNTAFMSADDIVAELVKLRDAYRENATDAED
tara:strand:- start:1621 stop:2592 length:972 start_codon:yes stop_codon:yes gene_type:complete